MTDDIEQPSTPPVEKPDAPTVEVTPPAPRGRGRPRKDAAPAPVSPSAPGAAKPTAAKASKRTNGKVKFEKDDIGQLAKQVEGLHKLMAMASGIPELAISPEESQVLGGAIANVCEEYDLSISGKTGAALQLLAACAMIYAPRLGQVAQRVKRQAAEAKAAKLRVVGGTDSEDATATDA